MTELNRKAEEQLDRELAESSRLPKAGRGADAPAPERHRVTYSLPLILLVSVIGGIGAYAISSLVVKFDSSTTWAYGLSALFITTLAWGVSGIQRSRVTATDRMIDLAVSLIVAPIVFGLIDLPPLRELFSLTTRSQGIAGVPRVHHIMGWSAIVACVAVAVTGLARLLLDRRRA
ncbi:MAG: hypothetical protein H6Q90_4217 [Deltaproteobacteria bacterium]|nr:hypothetical protein [Deltaproteobacteria bacterium]